MFNTNIWCYAFYHNNTLQTLSYQLVKGFVFLRGTLWGTHLEKRFIFFEIWGTLLKIKTLLSKKKRLTKTYLIHKVFIILTNPPTHK